MGRKRVVLTPEQMEERKARYWGPKRNMLRQQRYKTDPAYRETAIAQVRETYRRNRVKEGKTVRTEDCRDNLGRLPESGEVRDVFFEGSSKSFAKLRMLTVEELADLLGRHAQVLLRWQNAGLFPRAKYRVLGSSRVIPAFTVDEAHGLIEVFGDHQQRSQYLRRVHEETVQRLQDVVAEARRKLEEEYGTHDRQHPTDRPSAEKAAA